MPNVALQSAVKPLAEAIIAETKTVMTSAGLSDPDSRVFTEDTPYDLFPHAIVLFPDESRSLRTESKSEASVTGFPQVNFYDKGASGWEQVATLASDYISAVTDPAFSVSGRSVIFNDLVFNQRNSTSVADEAVVYSRSVQIEVHIC